ncbi:MAG: flagellar basal body P-ring formation chaperone FlgA [Planctomycetes bacterium]|nr:flagellar basal body P-ring formation chaperone FlgA [Planctomycetota bacterium]
MRRHLSHHIVSLAAALCIVAAAFAAAGEPVAMQVAAAAGPTTEAVQVRLRASAALPPGKIVRIADIAVVEGGDETLRARIAGCDIDIAPKHGQTRSIAAAQVAFRLRLTGLARGTFEVSGVGCELAAGAADDASGVEPQATADPASQLIFEATRSFVMQRLPWDESDIEIELARPVMIPTALLPRVAGATLVPELRSPWPPLGRTQFAVSIVEGGKSLAEVAVFLDVKYMQSVVLAQRPITRGQPITAEDVYLDRRDVRQLASYYTRLQDVVGQTAGQSIRPLEVVRRNHIGDPTGLGIGGPVLVHRGDRVQLLATVGGLMTVIVVGEALEDGRLGETIRVRNVESKRTVLAKVLNRHQVEVPL